jgi:hypothetical protein
MFFIMYLYFFNSLSLYPTIFLICIICDILGNKINLFNFGFNLTLTLIIFLVYLKTLNKTYNNIT